MSDYAGEVDVLAGGDVIRGAGVEDSVLGRKWLVGGALGTKGWALPCDQECYLRARR